MGSGPIRSPRPNNRLLARLPEAEYARLALDLQPMRLVLKKIMVEQRKPIDYVYFPTSGMISSMTVMSDGSAIEVGTVGNEGASGLSAAFGVSESPHRNLVQLPGEAWRIKAESLAKAYSNNEILRKVLSKYYTYFLAQVSQSVACNGLHLITQRCCRWLLISHDSAQDNAIPLTHEFLAIMLGVRRPSVTMVLQALQEREMVKCARGLITVLDRRALEADACECYQQVREEYDRVLK